MCAYAFVGADHMVLGSDYPHVIGDIKEAVTSIEQLDIPQTDKEKIFSGNMLRLIHQDSWKWFQNPNSPLNEAGFRI